ncbi:MAG: DsbA family protein [Armatimonadaceae bacterium]
MRFVAPRVSLSGKHTERNRYHSEFVLGALTTITVFHDYICPWCYVAHRQCLKLTEEFGVSFDWRGAELYPPGMVVPEKPKPAPDAPPPPPSRFDLFLEEEGITMPSRPPFRRSHYALMGAEWALLDFGPEAFDAYNAAVYRAYWEEHRDISKLPVLAEIATEAGLDAPSLLASLTAKRYESHIVPFDDEAYALNIRNVPTFIFGTSERLAEANYDDLARATRRFLLRSEKFRTL